MTKAAEIEKRVITCLEEMLPSFGVELVDAEFVKEAGSWYLRVYIDRQGGVTVDDCEAVSRKFDEWLDREDFIDESYIMEVSSPGLCRPLKRDRDFAWAMGRTVDVKLFAPVDGQKEFTGILKDRKNGCVTIDCGGRELSFAEKDMAAIRLSLEL